MNKVFLIGRVGKTPETSVFENGKKVTKFSLATNESYSKENKETSWHNIVVWDNYGETMGKLMKVGAQISAEGRIQYSTYERDGVKCVYTTIVVEKIELLDRKTSDSSDSDSDSDSSSNTSVPAPKAAPKAAPKPVQDYPLPTNNSDDDLPF